MTTTVFDAIWELFLPGGKTHEHDLRVLGRAIRELREQRGLGADALASAAGIARADLAAIEVGRLDPGYRRLLRLADALGVKPLALLLRVEELDDGHDAA